MTFEEAVTELEMALEEFGSKVTFEHCKLVLHADRLKQYIDDWREGGNIQ